MQAHKGQLYHLGVKQNVDHTTLSRANENRDWRIFADFGEYLICLVRPLYADFPVPNGNINNEVFALDSTTISLSINLFTWPAEPTPMHGLGAVLRSDDHGKTFSVSRVPFKMGGNEDGRGNGEWMAVDPHNGNVLFMGTASQDCGEAMTGPSPGNGWTVSRI